MGVSVTRAALKRRLADVRAAVQKEISANAAGGGRYASGLAAEGYAGGYLQCLYDLEAALGGFRNESSRYADAWRPEPKP
jgi:hypothetical protein